MGKGKDDRCFDLNRNEGHRKIRQMLKRANKDIVVVKVKENLFSHEALGLESKIIDILGLKSLQGENLLVNVDEGLKPQERRQMYPTGGPRAYLNKTKMQIYGNSVLP